MVYSPAIIVDILQKSIRDLTITNDMCDGGLIKVVKFVKPTDPKNSRRVDVIVHVHSKYCETKHFTYKNASHDCIKENLEWVQAVQ